MEKKSMFNRPISEIIQENAINNAGKLSQLEDNSIYSLPDSITDEELSEIIENQ